MNNAPNLFNYKTRFPKSPGHKRGGTSKVAADAIKERAPTLQERVLALLQRADLTADECAKTLGKSVLSIRPRLSELLALGKIFDTGTTRKNESGINATVWSAL